MKIRFCSPVKSHMGYAEMGRFVIDQLVQAGFGVSVLEIPMQGSDADFGELGAQAERLIGGADSADVNIVNMIPPLFERYRLPDAKNIGYTVFEADKIPANWVGQCNQMDALWVTSEWAKGVFASSGVQVPISVVGVHAIETAPTAPEAGLFRLLSIFQWSTRKNPVNLIAEPHLDDAIAKLRDVYGNYSAWSRNSLSHRQAICERYSLDRRVQRINYSV